MTDDVKDNRSKTDGKIFFYPIIWGKKCIGIDVRPGPDRLPPAYLARLQLASFDRLEAAFFGSVVAVESLIRETAKC